MVSEGMKARLKTSMGDILVLSGSQRVTQSVNDSQFTGAFHAARDLSQKWLTVAASLVDVTDDSTINPLVSFVERLAQLLQTGHPDPNETYAATIAKRTEALRKDLSPLRIANLEHNALTHKDADRLTQLSDQVSSAVEATETKATDQIKATLRDAEDGIRQKAADAVAEFELAKAKSQKISVGDAQTEFDKAAKSLRLKAKFCFALTALFFIALLGLLLMFTFRPPRLIGAVVDAMVPGSNQTLQPAPATLWIAVSAYFTSIRLAFIAVLGVGLAFSLKLTKAYLHMIEHNEHRRG